MALVNMRDMLYHAYENSYAVGAFDLVSLDFLEAVINAAESVRAPVILSIAEPHFNHYDHELLLPAVEAAARRASVPVAIQLDHGHSLDSAVKAINLGCNGVMLDASNLDLPDNIRITKQLVDLAHGCGVPVTGELGYIAGVEGDGAELHPGATELTLPSEAKAYVERTNVDFLSVSIGTVQGRVKNRAKIDLKRLKQLSQIIDIPLTIHGGTGLTDDQFRRITTLGVAKIDYFTGLSDVAAKALRDNAKQNRDGGFISLKQGIKEAIENEVIRCLKLWGSAGRAAEVLARCEPWNPIEHLIIYNIELQDEQDIHSMIAEGQRVLSGIPGVREVFAGETVKEGAKYRFCWLIRFAHESVIDSYRDHPDHVAFANKHFRPVAGDRISIDYQQLPTEHSLGLPEKPRAPIQTKQIPLCSSA